MLRNNNYGLVTSSSINKLSCYYKKKKCGSTLVSFFSYLLILSTNLVGKFSILTLEALKDSSSFDNTSLMRRVYDISYRKGSPIFQCPYLIEKKDPQECPHYLKETFCYFVKRQGQKSLNTFLNLRKGKEIHTEDCPVSLDQFFSNKSIKGSKSKSLFRFLDHKNKHSST